MSLAFLVYILFLLSGFAGLVYQTVWVRQLSVIFGVTTYAISTTLAAFFTGLALGAWLCGRWIERSKRHPLVLYGVMEGLIGVYALVLPALFALTDLAYPWLFRVFDGSWPVLTAFRVLFCFVLLVVPTTLMGATLPTLSKLMVTRSQVLGLRTGTLYGINTWGAVFGCFAAGFILIQWIGLSASQHLAAAVNIALAVLALALARRIPADLPDSAEEPAQEAAVAAEPIPFSPERTVRVARAVLALAFASGFCSLTYEVAWARALKLILGSTTYAFATMLTAFLIGIALGSSLFARIADRRPRLLPILSAMFFGIGALNLVGIGIVNDLPLAFLNLFAWTAGPWWKQLAAQFVAGALILLPPTLLIGGTFPLYVKLYSGTGLGVARNVGDVYSINTVGGIAGALAGGFVLIPLLGLHNTLVYTSLFLIAVLAPAALLLSPGGMRTVRLAFSGALVGAGVLAVIFVPRWDNKMLFSGWGAYAGLNHGAGPIVRINREERLAAKVLYHEEGATASVDCVEDAWGNKIFVIDAKPEATTIDFDLRQLQMLGHLPAMLHPDPKRALIVGLGAGISAGAMSLYPSLERIVLAELSPEVIGNARLWAKENHSILDNPKLHLMIADGGNYTRVSPDKYDIISTDPIHPLVAGVGNLYSRDHFLNCRRHLTPDGVAAQWLPLYQLSASDIRMILSSFISVFPEATLWFTGTDTVLIGSMKPLRVDPQALAVRLRAPGVREDLAGMGIDGVTQVLGCYIAGPKVVAAIADGAPFNTLDRPRLEFSAPRSVNNVGTSVALSLLASNLRLPPDNILDPAPEPKLAERIEDYRRALMLLMDAQIKADAGNPDAALSKAKQAYRLAPYDLFVRQFLAWIYSGIADARWNAGLTDEAVSFYQTAVLFNPHTLAYQYSLWQAYIQTDDLSAAMDVLEMAEADHPDNYLVLLGLGYVHLLQGDYEASEPRYRRARRDGRESYPLYVGLGVNALARAKPEQAHPYFRRALKIATWRIDPLDAIVSLLLDGGWTAHAKPYAQELLGECTRTIASYPADSAAYTMRARAHRALGDTRAAERDESQAKMLAAQ